MSAKEKLDDIIQRLSDQVDHIDEATKKIDETTGRMKYVISKTEELSKKCEIPLTKFPQLHQMMRGILDACSNFSVAETAQEAQPDDAATFEQFASVVETQLERCEKEIGKISALEEITQRITEK